MGSIIGATFAGIPYQEVDFADAFDTERIKLAAENDGVFERQVARLAAALYAETGQAGSIEFHLYDQLAKSAKWQQHYQSLIDPVLLALGSDWHRAVRTEAINDDWRKRAAAAEVVPSLLEHGIAWAPEMLKTLMLAGAAAGGGAGALYWGMNRDANEDDAKAEATQAKIDHYKRITHEISSRLAANNAQEAA